MAAARANLTAIVTMLHDPSSMMLDMLLHALKEGKLCIVDLSGMRGQAGFILSGLILQRIFDHNQEEFTKAQPETIPVIAVVEEAQSVLGSGQGSSAEGPYITWVKEGRKYDLGAMLITQQPASIPHEILSQGDNWFVFHLLSSGDLQALKRANAHFSDDILNSLLNEPIAGNCVFWSSVRGKTYPLSVRVMSFEKLYKARDPEYNAPEAETYARRLQAKFQAALAATEFGFRNAEGSAEDGPGAPVSVDVREHLLNMAAQVIKTTALIDEILNDGVPWMAVQNEIEKSLPENMAERRRMAYSLVPDVLNECLGKGKWQTEKRPRRTEEGSDVTWIVAR